MSIGKTMVSYVMGHAICRGYIDSVDSRLNDWPLIKNTLYENQKIIDLLNMNAGDQKYVNRSDFKDGSGDVDTISISRAMFKMSNLKKSKSKYNYNALLPHLLLNYISFKSGDDFENLLEDIFQNEAQIEQSVYFFKHPNFIKELGMKKLLGIVVLGLLFSGNAYAGVNEPGVTSIAGCDRGLNLNFNTKNL
jgi:hypothetical protein